MINETIIRLSEDNLVEVETVNEDNTRTVKHITFDELVEVLKASKQAEESKPSILTGVLPFNDAFGIHTIASKVYDEHSQIVFMYRKPQATRIQYYETVFDNTPIPGLIFAVKWTNRQVRALYVVAIKDDYISKDTPVYAYPFSNVGSYDYRVCFGRNNIFEIEYSEPASFHSLPSMFLAMPNNDDSYGSNLSKLAHRKLLEEINGKSFPNEWLKPIMKEDVSMTINDFMQKVML